eukprot:2679317-Rhodomonas_salina.2
MMSVSDIVDQYGSEIAGSPTIESVPHVARRGHRTVAVALYRKAHRGTDAVYQVLGPKCALSVRQLGRAALAESGACLSVVPLVDHHRGRKEAPDSSMSDVSTEHLVGNA